MWALTSIAWCRTTVFETCATCHTIPYQAIRIPLHNHDITKNFKHTPFHTIPYHTIPCHISYTTYPILPYHTIPLLYHSIPNPYQTIYTGALHLGASASLPSIVNSACCHFRWRLILRHADASLIMRTATHSNYVPKFTGLSGFVHGHLSVLHDSHSRTHFTTHRT